MALTKEELALRKKKWKQDNREANLRHGQKYRDTHPKRARADNLNCSYGLTLKDYQLLFDAQEGRCAVCKRHQSEFSYALHVDHCHETGKVRGLLCAGCNLGLGYYETKHTLFKEYLIQHSAQE